MRRHWYFVLVLALSPIAVTSARTGKVDMTHHATGTFTVAITPEAQGAAPPGGVPTARMALSKIFSGGLAGTALGTMLSAGVPGPSTAATYVAIDQFEGRLDGREGGFVLAHRGTMTKTGGSALSIVISPDSGTGELAGIAGMLAIDIRDGIHHYDLGYMLPAD